MHCGLCGAQDSIRHRTVDAEDSTTGMQLKAFVVFCEACGAFGIGFTTPAAMLDFGPPERRHVFAPDWKLPREWLRPEGGIHPEAARRVMDGTD